MKKYIYALIILVLISLGLFYVYLKTFAQPPTSDANILASAIIGSWTHSLNDPADPLCKHAKPDEVCIPNDEEELDFSIDGRGSRVFNSYIHSHPAFVDCTWSVSSKMSSVIAITCPENNNENYSIPIVSTNNETLVVRYGDGPNITYHRFVPIPNSN